MGLYYKLSSLLKTKNYKKEMIIKKEIIIWEEL